MSIFIACVLIFRPLQNQARLKFAVGNPSALLLAGGHRGGVTAGIWLESAPHVYVKQACFAALSHLDEDVSKARDARVAACGDPKSPMILIQNTKRRFSQGSDPKFWGSHVTGVAPVGAPKSCATCRGPKTGRSQGGR